MRTHIRLAGQEVKQRLVEGLLLDEEVLELGRRVFDEPEGSAKANEEVAGKSKSLVV